MFNGHQARQKGLAINRQHEIKIMNITYHELSNYNNGILITKSFDLDGLTHDEHLSEINDWLEQVSEQTGEKCDEWIVCDFEEIPKDFVDEYSLDKAFFDYLEALESNSIGREAFEAGIALGLPLDEINDSYHGEFESDEALGEDALESCDWDGMPDNLRLYFDVAHYGRDLALNSFSEYNGHYFHNC